MKISYMILGIVLVVLIEYVLLSLAGAVTLQVQSLLLQLTDPPQVPNGTQSLTIAYSGLQVHTSGGGWINASDSGTADLLTLLNLTKTLGSVNVPSNSTVDLFRFNITSATITINNTQYPVTLPNKQVLIHLSGRVNASSSLVADLSPTVITIITNSSPVFVMVPSVRAVLVGGVNSSAQGTGTVTGLNFREREELERIRPNITITSATLSTSNETTNVSITVKNNANTSIILRHALVLGNESVTASFNFTTVHEMLIRGRQTLGHTSLFFLNERFAFNRSWVTQMAKGINEHNGTVNASILESIITSATHNATWTASLHINESEVQNEINDAETIDRVEVEHERFRVLNFLVASDSTLLLPFTQEEAMSEFRSGGYTLGAGQTVTLMFTGEMSLASGRVILGLTQGQNYKVGVEGDRGARASINVTAS